MQSKVHLDQPLREDEYYKNDLQRHVVLLAVARRAREVALPLVLAAGWAFLFVRAWARGYAIR